VIDVNEHMLVVDDFFPEGQGLREAFDRRMLHTLQTNPVPSERFIWDYWHVPHEFTYHRCLAETFFDEFLYARFRKHLRHWALDALGIGAINGHWLSFYINGCEQRHHHDKGNGEWAWVYSLSHNPPRFSGGETYVMNRDEWLARHEAVWEEPPADPASERYRRIAPNFGRLIVFDSRVPHGVTTVNGTMNPVDGRVVMHGWLGAAAATIRGGLTAKTVGSALADVSEVCAGSVGDLRDRTGLVGLRLTIDPNGSVVDVRALSSTLLPSSPRELENALAAVRDGLRSLRFPASDSESALTVPLVLG
jgi:hypothetical protein